MSVRHILGISSGKDSVDRVESKPRPSREVREAFGRGKRDLREGFEKPSREQAVSFVRVRIHQE